MQAILESAIASSRQSQRSGPQLMLSGPVQLLQSLLAVNPVTATELVAHQISVQHILEADEEGLTMLGHTAGVPLHSLRLMRKQLLWGQPLELDAGQGRLRAELACGGTTVQHDCNRGPCTCNLVSACLDWHGTCCKALQQVLPECCTVQACTASSTGFRSCLSFRLWLYSGELKWGVLCRR